jgi:hypothetical protein
MPRRLRDGDHGALIVHRGGELRRPARIDHLRGSGDARGDRRILGDLGALAVSMLWWRTSEAMPVRLSRLGSRSLVLGKSLPSSAVRASLRRRSKHEMAHFPFVPIRQLMFYRLA